jgi:hypothetical protein
MTITCTVPLHAIDERLEREGIRLRRDRFFIPTMAMKDILGLGIEPRELAEKYMTFYETIPFYKVCPGGAQHHHWWIGGLEDHVKEMIGWMYDQKRLYKSDLAGVSSTDIVAAAFLHDLDKIWIYQLLTPEEKEKSKGKYHEKQEFRGVQTAFQKVDPHSKMLLELARFGIVPTDDQWSAILFHHGGFSPAHFQFGGTSYTGEFVNKRNPLACLLSMADLYSSQILGRSLS